MDGDAIKWRTASLYCFWVRYPKGDLVQNSTILQRFIRYGDELRVLEHDLTQCLNEFQQAHEALYHDAKFLDLKKFAVVYHVDNFYVRIHKLIEDVYRLFALSVGIDPKRRPAKGEPAFREQVKNALSKLKLLDILRCLQVFEENKWISKAVEARNLFVHQYRDDPGDPSFLGAQARYQDPPKEDALARDIRSLYQAEDIDTYAVKKANELSKTLLAVRIFRDNLFDALEAVMPDPLPLGQRTKSA